MRRAIAPGFLLILLMAYSCRPRYSPRPVYTVFNDFEAVAGWVTEPVNNSGTLEAESAHSGKFSYKVDKQNNFGYAYKNKLADISDKKISWIKISGYCMAGTERLSKSSVICDIRDPKDSCQKWSEFFLDEFTAGKKGQWAYFEKSIDIHETNDLNFLLSTYVWNKGTDDALYIDDFKIEFFE